MSGVASFFERDGDWFVGTDAARGPWDADACHAGPPTGLVARAAEAAVPKLRLARLTLDFERPIPMAGVRTETELIRTGRSSAAAAVRLLDRDGRICCRARSLHLAAGEVGAVPTAPVDAPRLAEMRPGPFPVQRTRHGRPAFGSLVEAGYPPGDGPDVGPTTMWLRTLPLLRDEELSPVQRLCPLADCGNAVSRNAELDEIGFVNPDLTITVHRPPEGDWLATRAVSHWHADGTGVADAELFDHLGPVGRAVQTLLLQRPS